MSEVCGKGSCSLSPRRVVKNVARQRWKILANVVKKSKDKLENASVRRFTSYGLLQTTLLDTESLTAVPEGHNAVTWYQYTCPAYPKFNPQIRHLQSTIDVHDLMGFNNTGNVCVWPSEEVLAYYCLKHPDIFRDKIVCELGGGMTCLAGIAVAKCTDAKEIMLTDGNENSVKNLQLIIERNNTLFGSTKVTPRLLLWGDTADVSDIEGHFDMLICADCLFMDQYREDLMFTLNKLLKPGGEVLMFAPTRSGTFKIFENLIKESKQFEYNVEEQYDDTVWDLHKQMKEKGKEVYDENIHYSLMLTMKKK